MDALGILLTWIIAWWIWKPEGVGAWIATVKHAYHQELNKRTASDSGPT